MQNWHSKNINCIQYKALNIKIIELFFYVED